MGYSPERKEAVLKKLMPPNNLSVTALAKDEGISDATLYNWRSQARKKGRLMPDSDNTPNGWTSKDKFAAVMETAAMNQADTAAYCREKGLYPECFDTQIGLLLLLNHSYPLVTGHARTHFTHSFSLQFVGVGLKSRLR